MSEMVRPATDHVIHDVFICYSRKDSAFAAALERALERYRPPRDLPVPQRALDVFRDEEDFTGTEYYGAVDSHLSASRKLILICSPHASASEFVNDEIRRFARSHPTGDMIPVLIGGLPNNEVKPGDESSMAFPPALCERLELPLATDYRGFNAQSDRLDAGLFRGAWYKLIADIYGRSRAEVEEREQKRRRRQRVVWGGTSTLIVAALGAALFAALSQRGRADAETRAAMSNELAAQSMAVAAKDPELGALLGIEGYTHAATAAVASALRVALSSLPDGHSLIAPAEGFDATTAVAFAPDMRSISVGDAQGSVRVLDVETGRAEKQIVDRGKPVDNLRVSPDGNVLAVIDNDGNSAIFDAATGRPVARIGGSLYWRRSTATSGIAAVVLRESDIHVVELEHAGAVRTVRTIIPRGYSRDRYERIGVLSPDGLSFAALEEDAARVTVTDLESGGATSRVLRSPQGLYGLVWSPKGTYLAAYSLTGFVVMDARRLGTQLSADAGSEIMVEDLSFSPDEALLATTDRGGSTSIWDRRKKEKVAILPGRDTRAYKPRFSPRGDLLSVIYADGQAEIWNLEYQRKIVALASNWGEVWEVHFAPDGGSTIVEYAKGRLAFWKSERWQPRLRLPIGYDSPEDLRIRADGSLVGIEKAAGWHSWNIESGVESSGNGDGFESIALAPPQRLGNRSLIVDGRDALLVDSASGRQILRFPHSDDVRTARFNPGGSCVVTVSGYRMASGGAPEDGNVTRVWDARTGAKLHEWRSGTFGPDGAFFAGNENVVVLYKGVGLVYRAHVCAPLNRLVTQAKGRVSRVLTPEERARYSPKSVPTGR